MDAATAVDQVRRFNRTVTERVGALRDHFLGRGRPLGEARLLWEVGAEGADVRELRGRLSLDSGYLSRMLRALEGERLVVVEASPGDGRVRRVRLTKRGRSERAELDRRAEGLARGLLEPLSEGQRARLVAAMSEVERLLTASLVDVAAEDPASPDARWCIGQYFAELDRRFDAGFDPARSIPADAAELVPPAGLLLVARLRGKAIGCGALKLHPGAPAELKRMWVDPSARGLGLGKRLLGELEARASAAGAKAVRLETNRALTEAIRLYRQSGFREVEHFNDEPYAHHWFEKRLAPARVRSSRRR
jgi:DNA-binding MarR family transcriptional regulator/ribosomal protein S18 acetylase RimI-like enzyme